MPCTRFGDVHSIRDLTSLWFFLDDVEMLLRDLYGNVDNDAIESLRAAVCSIVESLLKYLHPKLSEEYRHAIGLDWRCGIGLPEGYGVNGSMWRKGKHAQFKLIVRAFEILANPSTFSEYSVKFANAFEEHYKLPDNFAEFLALGDLEKQHKIWPPASGVDDPPPSRIRRTNASTSRIE